MKEEINVAYGRNFLFLKNFYDRIVKKKREEINKIFYSAVRIDPQDSILDVGTTPSTDEHQNLLISEFPNKDKINFLSNQNLDVLKSKYPSANFYLNSATNMPFKNNRFDYVVSTATIEHVGSEDNQKKLILECSRVAKKMVFITTPNRFFPVEFHTRLPFIHFFPQKIHRKILKFLGEDFLSKEENLNLITTSKILKILDELQLKNYQINYIRLFGIKSNILIFIKKQI